MKCTCYVWYIYIMRVNLEFPIMVNCIKTMYCEEHFCSCSNSLITHYLSSHGTGHAFKWLVINMFFKQMAGFNIQLFSDTYVMHHALFVSSSIAATLNQCIESLTTWTSWGLTFIINFQCQFMYNHFTTIKWYESFKFQKISSGEYCVYYSLF